jgi:uncharacterized protein (TIGR00297 family)
LHFILPPLPQILLGLGLAILVSLLAYGLHSLSLGGALAAAGLGTVVFGLGGLGWAALLLGFFTSSSGLSRLFKRRKAKFDEKYSKGSQRDAGQVLANGGISGLFVILHLFFPGAIWPWLGCAGALAAANADTWATELGVLNPRPPRLLTNWKPVEQGTSGAVSLTGTLAALGGSFLIALIAAGFWPGQPVDWLLVGGITLAGLLGSLVDSFFGATIQSIYYCPTCNKETERHPRHTCGTATQKLRGLGWLGNDWVNTACTLAGGLLAVMLGFI